jgi:hypothetical protein
MVGSKEGLLGRAALLNSDITWYAIIIFPGPPLLLPMSARASRRTAAFDFSTLSPIECLLIAQAAHEFGVATQSWSTISKLMAKHPLVSRPKNFFTPLVRLLL